MTKAQALAEYIAIYYPNREDLQPHADKVRARCGFLDYLDTLQKDGRITEHQRRTWTAPRCWY